MSSYASDVEKLCAKKRKKLDLMIQRPTFPKMNVYDCCREFNIDSYILEEWCAKDEKYERAFRPKLTRLHRGVKPYDEQKHPQIIEDYMAQGKTKKGLCGELGIGYTTLMSWVHKYKSARNAYDRGLARGAGFYDELGYNQMVNPDREFDSNLYRILRSNSNSQEVRKGLIGKNVSETLTNLINQFVDSNPDMGKDEANTVLNIVKTIAEVKEMEKLKEQLEDLVEAKEEK